MRVGEMVRQLVEGCSVVVHAARLAAVVKVSKESFGAGGCPQRRSVEICRARASKARHQVRGPAAGQSAPGQGPPVIFLAIAHRLLRGCARPVILVDWTQAGRQHASSPGGSGADRRSCAADLPGGPSAEEAGQCRGREAVPVRVEGNSAAGVPGRHRVRRRLQGTILPGGTRARMGFPGPRPGDHQGHLRRRPDDLEGGVLRASVDHPCGSGPLRTVRQTAHSLPAGDRSQAPQARPQAAAAQMQRRTRTPAIRARSVAPRHLPVRRRRRSTSSSLYAKRMQIEETFRDAKNHRFGWSLGDVRLSTPNRTAALLVLAALALVVVTLIGMAAERRGVHRGYQANTEQEARPFLLRLWPAPSFAEVHSTAGPSPIWASPPNDSWGSFSPDPLPQAGEGENPVPSPACGRGLG